MQTHVPRSQFEQDNKRLGLPLEKLHWAHNSINMWSGCYIFPEGSRSRFDSDLYDVRRLVSSSRENKKHSLVKEQVYSIIHNDA